MKLVSQLQHQLLEDYRYLHPEEPLSPLVKAAFRAVPRHLFIKRYKRLGSSEWQVVTPQNLEQHLPTLYRDHSLTLLENQDGTVCSSISQPTLVLQMLHLLQLKRGQRVFELGAGSGWNAALMGHIVGPKGRVYSLEIVPEIADAAQAAIQALGITNVEIVVADGADAYEPGAPYDRAIFTAGTYDLPHSFYQQLKDQSLLLVVIKHPGGGDSLFLLRKAATHFESLASLPCGFVPVTGKSRIDSLDPILLDDLPEWQALSQQEVGRMPFWWGDTTSSFIWKTHGIRAFLGIVEPLFQVFVTAPTASKTRELFFGLLDRSTQSLVLARKNWLIAYGNPMAQQRLLQRIHQWIDLGMPEAANFKLLIYPIDAEITLQENQWVVRRQTSQFVWSLHS